MASMSFFWFAIARLYTLLYGRVDLGPPKLLPCLKGPLEPGKHPLADHAPFKLRKHAIRRSIWESYRSTAHRGIISIAARPIRLAMEAGAKQFMSPKVGTKARACCDRSDGWDRPVRRNRMRLAWLRFE
jgi:hypothetical protein